MSYFSDTPASILVAGGDFPEVELIDFANNGADSCLAHDHTPHHHRESSAIFVDGKPTICGGGDYWVAGINGECHSFDLHNIAWVKAHPMVVAR